MGWSVHHNIDMYAKGDKERIRNWRSTHSIEDLKRIVEQKGYSAISVCSGGFATLKQFSYQLTPGHCKPTWGYTNTFYIYSGGGSGGYATAAAGAGGAAAGWQAAKFAYNAGALATGAYPTTGHMMCHAAEFAVGEAVGAAVAAEAAGGGAAAAVASGACSIQ